MSLPDARVAEGARVVVAVVRARPGQAPGFAALMREHARASRAEPGCQVFDVSRGADDDAVFLLYERYADARAYLQHRETEHYARFRRLGVPMLEHGAGGPFVARHVLDRLA